MKLRRHSSCLSRLSLLAVLAVVAPRGGDIAGAERAEIPLRAVMLADEQVTPTELASLKSAGNNAVVLQLNGRLDDERRREARAAQRIQQAGLTLYYWVEIARCPELADAHPRWMASLQGHAQWRRLFPDAPQPRENVEVVKTYPWVPVLYEEAFAAHLQRVERLLNGMPTASGILLNDLQGAPSACGCGNTLCRWTGDYGPIKTATALPDRAAADFVQAVAKLAPESEVIPVWVTECEQHDGAKDGWCAGVGCFEGICWRAWTAQLAPLAKQARRLAVLLCFRELNRDLPIYREQAAWIRHGLKAMESMPSRHGGSPVAASRLLAVLQGWDVTDAEVAAQKRHARDAGAAGYVVARTPIDQRWQPRLHRIGR